VVVVESLEDKAFLNFLHGMKLKSAQYEKGILLFRVVTGDRPDVLDEVDPNLSVLGENWRDLSALPCIDTSGLSEFIGPANACY
jgi:hypothetical protein